MLVKKKGWGKFLAIALIFTFLFQCVGMIVPEPANAASTELTITKYAGDGKTIIDQLTVDYHWLMDSDNIPVLGDGTTRYYHQGPVFIDEPADDPVELERLRWNEEEDRNWDTKDMGAVKGNNLKDLCNLVGGMVESDEVQIKATDGFNKKFAYKNVYNYDPDREGPMVVCWYKDGLYPDTGYTDGMRLVWFAAASSKVGPTDVAGLPSGDYHVFGNWEWREAADPEYWYYYSGIYPTTTGLSVQNVASINIYSNETVLTPPDLTADTEDNQIGQAVDITFTDDEDWRTAISRIRVNGREIDGENYSLSPGKISIVADVFDQAGEYNIAVIAEGYSMVTVTQSMASGPVAAFTVDKTSGPAPLTVQFTDESTENPTSWAWDFDNDGVVDSTEQNPSYEYTAVGTYTVKLTVNNDLGSDEEIKEDYITVTDPAPKTWYVDDSGGADFSQIQDAVTAAKAGDTIIVKDGTYTENITVDKSLTIESENGADKAIVQAAVTNADVFKVTAENVTIDGFTVSGATSTGKSGISVSGSCTVINNLTSGNSQGISIMGSNNTVSNNTCTLSGRYGIYLFNATGNTVNDNVISNNTESSGYALYLADNADNNLVSGNISDSNTYGIRVKAADSNTIINNTFSNNTTGIEIATKPVGNVFYLNNFINNGTQANEGYNGNTENFWNSPTEISYTYKGTQYSSQLGNYWSDYVGSDENGDGIGDSPYATIASYNDNYPLMGSWQDGVITPSAVAVTGVSITEGDQELEIGQTVQLTAVVEPGDANNKNVSWSSSDKAVATVSATGLVTAVAEGIATITVTTEDGNMTDSITVTVADSSGPAIDVLFEGTVVLTPGETFTVSVGSTEYTIDDNTPLGALQAAAEAGKFSYLLSDKRWSYDGVLLLDDVGQYVRKSPGYWYAYVNDVYKDGYQNTPDGLNVIEMLDGDKVEFYYAAGISDPNDLNAVKAAATAAVKTVVALSTIDVIYDGTLNLDPEEEFIVSAYNSGTEYTVNQNTPLGALHKAAIASGFTYDVTDKNYGNSGALLLDRIADYNYVKNGSAWYAYVNGALKDGYNNPDGALNLIQLADGDKVEFYYADVEDETDFNAVKAAATAAVKITVANGVVPTDWTLQLSGARDETIPKAYFEQGLACPSSGHQVSWTDDKGTPDTSDDDVWSGVPLWLLVAMVDDNPDLGDEHINFNDELAAAGYEVKVIAGDGWSTVLDSADIARSDAYIIANTLNGEALPLKTESGKDCWPLQLKGSAISGGQQVGNIVRIELSGLPEPPAGWTLEMLGEIGDTITQAEFEEGLACTGSGHCQEWTDQEGKVWSGVPLWVLLGVVDDIENGGHWTFKENLANSYTVKVVAGDGFSKTFNGADVAKSNDYIVANIYDGKPISDGSAPLRLVGDGVTKEDGSLGGLAVGNIARIEIPELQTPPAADGSWNLTLDGIISDVISQAEFEEGLACPYSGHLVEWTDADGNVWSGIPLWYLAGWVDDRQPHSYDFNQAVAGYKVIVKAADGYSVDFDSQAINKSSDYIIANKCNGVALTDSWPLRLVGDGVANAGALTGKSVGQVVEIKLTSFTSGDSGDIPELRIVKYGEDGTTIIAEETLTYLDMIEQFDVIGDGETLYKYQGVTFDPEDIWDENETGKGGFKIANAIKGTRVSDLCSLVDGMGTGTDIVFVASDGWETKLPYSSIYPDPSVYARQGDAILAWFADGKYVPDYRDGMRLFFTPEDKVYSQMDMHETLPEAYWHYYYDEVMYPSCAGLSAKYVTEIRVYSVPQGDWTLELDGTEIGGIESDISKTYFESALTCTFGANHKASYTDSKNRVWEGMPLWFLVGFVDDADQHSNNAFNDALAESGYQVVITAGDGASVTIDSTNIIRNNNYIVANTLNEFPIPESDDNWPLRLVGPAVSGSSSIGNVISIKLIESSSLLTPPNLTADSIDNKVGQPIDIDFIDDPDWRTTITGVKVNGNALSSGQYAVSAGKITIMAGVFNAAGDYTVLVSAQGYEDAEIIQVILADTPGNPVYTISPVNDDAYINGITVDGINTMTVKTGISGFRYFAVNITPVTPHTGQETVVFTHLRNGVQLGINATRADFDLVSSAQAGFNVKAGDVIKAYIVDELTNDPEVNPIVLQ
jgi:parallel beta-helix repeat protein